MRLRLITPPSGEPVSSTEAKAHLRVDTADDDALIVSHITTARQRLDGQNGLLGRALLTQTWEAVLDGFPCGFITLPLPPLVSVTSIKYQDGANTEQTLNADQYEIDSTSTQARIYPVAGASWPQTYATINAVTIQFECGYGNAAAVPEPIKTAIKLIVQMLHDNLNPDDAAAVDRAVDSLVFPYRVLSV